MTAAPEFSRPFQVEALRSGETRTVTLTAEAGERAALARRFGVLGIEHLEGRVTVARAGKGGRLTGQLEAQLTQACTVTVEPVASVVRAALGIDLVPASDAPAAEGADALAGDEDEPDVEPLDEGGAVDLGELLAQTLSLHIPEYPRAPGAAWEDQEFTPEGPRPSGEGKENPFAQLAALRPRKDQA